MLTWDTLRKVLTLLTFALWCARWAARPATTRSCCTCLWRCSCVKLTSTRTSSRQLLSRTRSLNNIKIFTGYQSLHLQYSQKFHTYVHFLCKTTVNNVWLLLLVIGQREITITVLYSFLVYRPWTKIFAYLPWKNNTQWMKHMKEKWYWNTLAKYKPWWWYNVYDDTIMKNVTKSKRKRFKKIMKIIWIIS